MGHVVGNRPDLAVRRRQKNPGRREAVRTAASASKEVTYAFPSRATAMSLKDPPAASAMSAWTAAFPPAKLRISLWVIEATSKSPSGKKPRPNGRLGTSATTVTLLSRSMR
jgi:hypothetical protein